MNPERTVSLKCQQALRLMDPFLDRELSPSESMDVDSHLAVCPACAQELRARQGIQMRVRRAVRQEPVSLELETRIRATLAIESPQTRGWRSWSLAAAAVIAGLAVGLVYRDGHLRVTPAMREDYVESESAVVSPLMRTGLGDHIHCAYFRSFSKMPPPMSELKTMLGPRFQNLINILQAHAPARSQVVLAHRCNYHDRRFVHLALQGQGQLVSLVITRKRNGESLAASGLTPILAESGIRIYRDRARSFELGSFETGQYLVYVVSNLPRAGNQQLTVSLAPEIRSYLEEL